MRRANLRALNSKCFSRMSATSTSEPSIANSSANARAFWTIAARLSRSRDSPTPPSTPPFLTDLLLLTCPNSRTHANTHILHNSLRPPALETKMNHYPPTVHQFGRALCGRRVTSLPPSLVFPVTTIVQSLHTQANPCVHHPASSIRSLLSDRKRGTECMNTAIAMPLRE